MSKIFKYPLEFHAEQQIIIPHQIERILTVQMQGDVPMLWAQVREDEPPLHGMMAGGSGALNIVMVGTGYPFDPRRLQYLNTVQQGRFIWHFYAEW